MGWYTTYTITVELTECLTKDFAETLVENGGFNVCGEGTTLMLTTDYKRGGLSQLADIMNNLSFKLDGMYRYMTGTFEGQDGYAEMQLDATREMAGADCDCREIVYRILGNGKEKWLEIQYVFNLPKPKLIRLTADGKRAGAKETLDSDDSDDAHCYEVKKKRGLKKIPKSDTEPDTVEPNTEELDADDNAEMEKFATLNDVGGAVIGQDDDAPAGESEYNKNTTRLEEIVKQIEADAKLGKDVMAGKRIPKKNPMLDALVAQLDADPLDFTPIKIGIVERFPNKAGYIRSAPIGMKTSYTVNNNPADDLDDPVPAVVNSDTGDVPANNEEPETEDTDSEQDTEQAPRKSGWCSCRNRFDIYSDDESE